MLAVRKNHVLLRRNAHARELAWECGTGGHLDTRYVVEAVRQQKAKAVGRAPHLSGDFAEVQTCQGVTG
jgi:hypothetical protein